ncbi:hypothetical protein Pyn_26367 [Prunus yedoensis var. nudiflora]|uniref:Uncharacterized protein n=1 Tax=Prunus yedoensis var. nudiflora TaxID=2094558 RepID=A0A314ZUX4_PRUYE|nr:hypothetical protein Pyn_26367 [Prunus yedoensis var. nudiflora]
MGREPAEYPARGELRVWIEDSKDPKVASEKDPSRLSGKENRPATEYLFAPEPGLIRTRQRVPPLLARKSTREFQWRPSRLLIS